MTLRVDVYGVCCGGSCVVVIIDDVVAIVVVVVRIVAVDVDGWDGNERGVL